METTIKSRVFGTTTFYMSDNGGYVYETTPGEPDKRKQICNGGGYFGNTVASTPANFVSDCKRWHRQRLALAKG